MVHDMLNIFLNIREIYAAIGILLAVWFVFLAATQLDRFDWAKLDKLEAIGFLVLSAVAWPMVVIKVPKSLRSIRALAPVDYRTAAYMREVDRLTKDPPHCSSMIRHCQYENGVKVAEHFFSPADIVKTIENSEKRYWGAQPDDYKILAWTKSADMADHVPVDTPWVWNGFELLADEMLRAALGSVRCFLCGKTYSAKELTADSETAASGWIRNRQRCPEKHLVLDYDFIKPFCNHKKQAFGDADETSVANPIETIPSFLKKS